MHLFYISDLSVSTTVLTDEENHHCINVMRHKVGDTIQLTDGNGKIALGKILSIGKKGSEIDLIEVHEKPLKNFGVHLAISPTKQMERMEWMVEKLCEMAVDKVTFLRTENSERQTINLERLDKKTVSALKQSRSGWKTQLYETVTLKALVEKSSEPFKFVATVSPDAPHLNHLLMEKQSILLLIGPEGDFSQKEIEFLVQHNFIKVSLGIPVLRTETAALAACWSVNFINKY